MDPITTFDEVDWRYVIVALGLVLILFSALYPELQRVRAHLRAKLGGGVGETAAEEAVEGFRRRNNDNNNNNKNKFMHLSGTEMYDDEFYVSIYDKLVHNETKNNFELQKVMALLDAGAFPLKAARVLDCGSGTGHHVAGLCKNKIHVVGVDKSRAMVKASGAAFPDCVFTVGDVLAPTLFQPNEFTHITCFYFTLYYIRNKQRYANNCFQWLKPNGLLVLHVVNRDKFDPMIPPSSPFLIVSPQKYAKERITTSSVTFNDFTYNARFDVSPESDQALFTERFQNRDDRKTFRKQTHVMYMEAESAVVETFANAGFIVEAKIDLVKVAYDFQYLYVFRKPY